MLELDKVIKGSPVYYTWMAILLGLIGLGTAVFIFAQLEVGLGITGMSRDVSWGFYIAQLTFLVGVAASGLMVVLPYYLHNFKDFGRITILGEFVAIAAVIMCMTFVFVDMGMPHRILNVPLNPTPNSPMFWDFLVLSVYMGLNIVISITIMSAEKRRQDPPYYYLKPLIYASIACAPMIHTVTAFLYAGLPGRHLWMTAILAIRFLGSAFAAGPAFLVILYLLMNFLQKTKPNQKAVSKLAQIITYAMIVNMFCLALEVFTAFYSNIPGHMHSLEYLFFGLTHGEHTYNALQPFMWVSVVLGVSTIILLLFPGVRNNTKLLVPTLICLFLACWIDKGLGLIMGGFVPSPLGHITEYVPTIPEMVISIGIFSIGALIITVLFKMIMGVREDNGPQEDH